MRAGRLRHRIEILSTTVGGARDSYGDDVVTWGTLVTVWADIRDLDGREYFAADQVHATVTARAWIRYRTGITSAMRLQHGERLFDIVAVLDNGRREYLELMLEEIEQ